MKIPQCKNCVGQIIGCVVSNGNLHKGSACENFHNALVKKFTSTNTGMDAICPDCGSPIKIKVEVLVKQHHT